MEVENVSSEIQLKREIYISARDGKAASIIEKLRKMDKCGIVKEILDHHTETENEIMTPLIVSARNGHEHVVTVLLRLGADVEQTGTIVIKKQTIKEATPLWCAAAVGHLGLVKLLVEYGANINSKTIANSTPLRAACYSGYLNIVEFLIEHGADINTLNYAKATSLSLACGKEHYSVVEYMIRKGADINIKSASGATALHECAENGSVKLTDLLLRNGAIITTNENNETPLIVAALRGNTDVVEYFVTKTYCSRKERTDALELLGTTFAVIPKYHDIDKAYHYLMKGMKERGIDNDFVDNQNPVPAFENWIECRNIQELDAIQTNINALKMECLVKRQRILGLGHPEVIRAIAEVGDDFIDDREYTKGLNLRYYALKQYKNALSYVDLCLPKTLAYIIEMNHILQLNIVLDALLVFTNKLESFFIQMEECKRDIDLHVLQDRCEDITQDCVYLIGILLTISTDGDHDDIYRAIYKFIRLVPQLKNGYSPLHMCCSNVQYTEYDPLLNVIQFPNALLCKAFVTCGSNVNAMDNDHNTPLHTIARCVDTDTDDIDPCIEIITYLIENGAHTDIRNKERKTAADEANTDFVKSIIMENTELNLKCLAATVVRKHGIVYVGIVSKDLEEFIELH